MGAPSDRPRGPGRSPASWWEAERPRVQPLRSLPSPLRLEVGLHPVTHACVDCTATRKLGELLAAERLPVEWLEVAPVLPGHEGVAAPPPWLRVLLPVGETGPVRFLGPPRGDLLEGLVRIAQDVASPTPPSADIWQEVLTKLRRRHHFRVYAAARCGDAPDVIRFLARVVHAAPDRTAMDVLDVETFPREARKHGVRHLPTVTIDDFAHFYGNPDERTLAHSVADILPSGNLPYPSVAGGGPTVGL